MTTAFSSSRICPCHHDSLRTRISWRMHLERDTGWGGAAGEALARVREGSRDDVEGRGEEETSGKRRGGVGERRGRAGREEAVEGEANGTDRKSVV